MELSELIKKINIVDFLSQYVDLEQRNEEFWGLSPFTNEKTPSFSVREDPPVFYDYSSGLGGNVFTFTKHYFKCSPHDAIEILKKYAGVSGNIGQSGEKMTAVKVCSKYKPKTSIRKPSKSTILPDDFMERYELQDEKLDAWRKEGISDESLSRFQVRYDSFSNRIVYPIRNLAGKIVNIGGRTVDPEWKAKNQRKYCYFYPWGTIDTIYGLSENIEFIKNKKEIILFEGCKSVLLADTWGIKNTGAILTSHLSINQMKILARLGCRVVFALDKDVDIRKDVNIEKLKGYLNVEYIRDTDYLNEKDSPVDQGEKVFRYLYGNRLHYK